MEFKRFIKSIFRFCLLLIPVYLIVILLWGTFRPKEKAVNSNLYYHMGGNGHMYSRLRDIKNYSDVDILFLGSSRSYRGFDPRIFQKHDYQTFNLGSSSQTPVQTQYLLDKYLTDLNPRLIVYEVYSELFSLDGVESALDIIANGTVDVGEFLMALKINHLKVYNSLFYAVERDILDLYSGFSEAITKGGDTYISGGYVETTLSQFQNKELQFPEKFIFKDYQLKAFQQIINKLKEKNINFILVNAPTSQQLYNNDSSRQAFDSIMHCTGKYYDFNTILQLSDSPHFYDPLHLNQSGVEQFNLKLIEILKSEGF